MSIVGSFFSILALIGVHITMGRWRFALLGLVCFFWLGWLNERMEELAAPGSLLPEH